MGLSTVRMGDGHMTRILESSSGLTSCTIIDGSNRELRTQGLDSKTWKLRVKIMMQKQLLNLNVLLFYHLKAGVRTHLIVFR